MSSKVKSGGKRKKEVSQNDLRKMMQQMKAKRSKVESTGSNHSNLKRTHIPDHTSSSSKHLKYSTAADSKRDLIINNKRASSVLVPSNGAEKVRANGSASKSSATSVVTKTTSSKQFKKVQPPKKVVAKVKSVNPLLGADYGSSSDEDSDNETNLSALSAAAPTSSAGAAGSSSSNEPADVKDLLPEGFFDDADTDAKMRGVETKADKMDREWEMFKKEVRHEEDQSEQIIEEEQETGNLDRQLDEIDEQIQLYNLMDKLHDRKESTLKKLTSRVSTAADDDVEKMDTSSADEDDDSVSSGDLDWREKDVFT